jgi:hypothetical protein
MKKQVPSEIQKLKKIFKQQKVFEEKNPFLTTIINRENLNSLNEIKKISQYG